MNETNWGIIQCRCREGFNGIRRTTWCEAHGMITDGQRVNASHGIADPKRTWRGWRDKQPSKNPITIRWIGDEPTP